MGLHSSVGEHCSANAEAMGSNPVEALKFFSGLNLQLLKLRLQLRWSNLYFICISAVHIIFSIIEYMIRAAEMHVVCCFLDKGRCFHNSLCTDTKCKTNHNFAIRENGQIIQTCWSDPWRCDGLK